VTVAERKKTENSSPFSNTGGIYNVAQKRGEKNDKQGKKKRSKKIQKTMKGGGDSRMTGTIT